MKDVFIARTRELQRRIKDEGIDVLLLTDPNSVYYISAYWGDLGVEFGRPTVLAVPKDGELTLITPKMESEMAAAMTWVAEIRTYVDGVGDEWRDPLRDLVGGYGDLSVGVERYQIPALVSEFLRAELGSASFADGSPALAQIRMVKSPREVEVIRQAGQVAVAMGAAGKATIGEGVPEFEVTLAAMVAGSRKAAEFIAAEDPESMVSPVINQLQALQSGHFTAMAHRRPTVRRMQRGDPVYMCFCPIAHFKHFKLGYDREYWVGEVSDEHARMYEVTIAAQKAAVDVMRPGITAEEVHLNSIEVYKEAGLANSYRTGRAIGYSSLELPELKEGDKTILEPGMAFAVDGGVTVPGRFGTRIGDTIVVTETGSECVTEFPRHLEVL